MQKQVVPLSVALLQALLVSTPEDDDALENDGANENDSTQRMLLGNPMLVY